MSAAEGERSVAALSEFFRGGSPGGGFLRISLLTLFLGLVLFEGVGLWRFLSRRENFSVSADKMTLTEESTRLESMVRDFTAAMLSRQTSRQLVALTITADRRPFAPAGSFASPVVVEASPLPQENETAREILPPYIALRAVFLMGEKRSAVLDVEGESPELLVERGTKFGGGLGKVLSISEKKVVVSWAGRRMEIRMEE